MRKPKPLRASDITMLALSIKHAGLAHANLKLVFPIGTEVAFMHEGKRVEGTIIQVLIREGIPSIVTDTIAVPIPAAQVIKI